MVQFVGRIDENVEEATANGADGNTLGLGLLFQEQTRRSG